MVQSFYSFVQPFLASLAFFNPLLVGSDIFFIQLGWFKHLFRMFSDFLQLVSVVQSMVQSLFFLDACDGNFSISLPGDLATSTTLASDAASYGSNDLYWLQSDCHLRYFLAGLPDFGATQHMTDRKSVV